jgi:hypothetical protein
VLLGHSEGLSGNMIGLEGGRRGVHRQADMYTAQLRTNPVGDQSRVTVSAVKIAIFRDFSHEHHQMYTAQLRMYTAQLPGAQVTCDYPRAVAGCRPQGHFHRKNAFFR